MSDDARTVDHAGFLTLTRRELLWFLRQPSNAFAPPFIADGLCVSVCAAVSNGFENASSTFHGRWDECTRTGDTRVSYQRGGA